MLRRTSGLFRATTLQYASSYGNLLIVETRTSVFPVGCPNIQFLVQSCSNFDDHGFSLLTRFVRWLNSVLVHKAKKMTQRELSKQTPDCIGAKLLITSAVLRAYRTRHLGTFVRCCEAWSPIGDCFDTHFFECIDFQRLSQIFCSSCS